ncbi:MAG TPA: LptA/OstA family protein, partial [Lentimicrobium sp.]|nr:LptA/OstA family protein [Lentimicrobium sp.]
EAWFLDKQDTLFMHSDTMRATFDSAQKTKEVFAYYHVKFYRDDIQGLADSIVYKTADSTMRMLGMPVLWTDENQLTADSIYITTANKEVRNMFLYNAAFIISKDTLGSGYNQIKGRNMTGYFLKNDLTAIRVQGNSETIYWVREEDGTLTGINKGYSSNMAIRLRERKMKQIVYIEKPNAVLYPEGDLKPDELLLKNFKWLGDRRPLKREDIFIW